MTNNLITKWTTLHGTSASDYAGGIAIDNDGNSYIIGRTEGDLDGKKNNGGQDIFLAKFNSNGGKIWTELIGTDDTDRAYDIAINNESIFITGSTRGNIDGYTNIGGYDAFFSKFNLNGNKEWTNLINTSVNDYAKDIKVDNEGSIFILGETDGNLDSKADNGVKDIYITKFNKHGFKQWTVMSGSSDTDYASNLVIADDGSLYVSGYTFGNLDGRINAGYGDGFISKFNSSGIKQWTQLVGTSDDDRLYDLIINQDNFIYVIGNTFGNLDNLDKQIEDGGDGFISKFNSEGIKIWTKLIASPRRESAYDIAADSNGYLYVSGRTDGTLDGEMNNGSIDVFISKFNTEGVNQWTELIGTSKDESVGDIQIGSDGTIYITGSTYGELNGEINQGGNDAYIVALKEKDPESIQKGIYKIDQVTVGEKYLIKSIQDYDGNLHGFLGNAPTDVITGYKYQGKLDVNNDGVTEAIFTNKESGRWVTASIDKITGFFDYTKHGARGTTRIVGIYEDPLVAAGLVEKDSDLDGSRTFINDLKLDNLILKTVGDYDGDGFQEVYWSKVDNTAYLRAVMHADGNIQYANYQNFDQMTNYLIGNGFADTVALIA